MISQLVIFLIYTRILKHISKKCQSELPEALNVVVKCLACPTNTWKPKDISITITNDKENPHQILIFENLEAYVVHFFFKNDFFTTDAVAALVWFSWYFQLHTGTTLRCTGISCPTASAPDADPNLTQYGNSRGWETHLDFREKPITQQKSSTVLRLHQVHQCRPCTHYRTSTYICSWNCITYNIMFFAQEWVH